MAKGNGRTISYRRERQFGILFGATAVLFCVIVGMLIARGILIAAS
jgi:hypothetical protein